MVARLGDQPVEQGVGDLDTGGLEVAAQLRAVEPAGERVSEIGSAPGGERE